MIRQVIQITIALRGIAVIYPVCTLNKDDSHVIFIMSFHPKFFCHYPALRQKMDGGVESAFIHILDY